MGKLYNKGNNYIFLRKDIMSQNSSFKNFTNLYALSKTLRFELKPIGKTLENMYLNLKYDKNLKTFLKDQDIEDAYQTLKPIFDYLHEKFISESLEVEAVLKIDFSGYLAKYKMRKDLKDKDFESIEKQLRSDFDQAYKETAEIWKIKAGKNTKGKDIFKERGYKILTENGILEFIEKNIEYFLSIKSREEIVNALTKFKGFFTYFGGFNLNRENYYETKKEASTAVATRIISENLPKFCDNLLFFDAKAEEYKSAYFFLESTGKSLVNKEGELLCPIIEDFFRIEFFNKCCSQKQIEQYNKKIGNANFIINLYNQAKNLEERFKKLTFFKTLYRQIGCGKKKALFFTLTHDTKMEAEKARSEGKEAYSVEEILLLAKGAGDKYFSEKNDGDLTDTVPAFLKYIKSRENYQGIYWSKMAINTISNKYFANWYDLKDKLKEGKVFTKNKKGSEEDVKIPDAIELEEFFRVINQTLDWKKDDIFFKKNICEKKKDIILTSKTPSEALLKFIFSDIDEYKEKFLNQSKEIAKLEKYNTEKNKEAIKTWFDNALAILQMIKYFLVRENKVKGNPIDSVLSQSLKILLKSNDAEWFKWYDALRNYLTKHPQDEAKENKLKLNFENSSLAGGWDINKEPDNYCIILQNNEKKKFLAIITKNEKQKNYKKIFEENENNQLYTINEGEVWQKMRYKLLPGPNKMLPKCLLPKKDRSKYGASEEILKIYDSGSFKKNEPTFSISDLCKIIDFFKSALQKYEQWNCYNFSFRPTHEYQDISQFYADVEKQGYRLSFVNINKTFLDQLINEGKIYLFEIKNQDSNKGKKNNHKDNLHTMYWNAIFEGIENRPKINGEAELFYRKAISPEKLEKTKDKNGKIIVKNYRYSKEKFLFHVPITLNFCLKNKKINEVINNNLLGDEDVYFLGIDRGEKHLAYYSLVDRNGNLVIDKNGKAIQGTLNMPFFDTDGQNRTVKAEKRTIKEGKEQIEVKECADYNELIEARSGDRDYARKNWQIIGTIKELKDGYISQVVRKIADLAVENKALIVLEDLNTGFKRGRQKIEKSVYQKFELALAKKLNFLVDKSAINGEIGSVTKALQLTPLVQNYGDIENRKQVGIMFYVRANYTSQTDPISGWRKSIYLKKGSEKNIKEQILNNFSDIRVEGNDYVFVYIDKNTKKEWKLYSSKDGINLDRYRGKRNRDKNIWEVKKIDTIGNLNDLFGYFDKNQSLLLQIKNGVELKKVGEYSAYESLRFAIEIIQQIRNTGIEKKDDDFILSPVRDSQGNHFDSRKAKINEPTCGDANGAFNIARKGILMAEHIKKGYSPFIFDAEWDSWLAGKEIWDKWIQDNNKILKRKKSK